MVQEFDIYWVLASSEPIPVARDTTMPAGTMSIETMATGTMPAGSMPTGTMDLPEGRVIPLKEAGVADILVRLHG